MYVTCYALIEPNKSQRSLVEVFNLFKNGASGVPHSLEPSFEFFAFLDAFFEVFMDFRLALVVQGPALFVAGGFFAPG